MNKNYTSGRRFEYRVKKYLEKKGYYVMRSAGSKSPFDLIAIPKHNHTCGSGLNILLIQCKHGTKISKAEREKNKTIDFSFKASTVKCMCAWSKKCGKIEFCLWEFSILLGKYHWIKIGWL